MAINWSNVSDFSNIPSLANENSGGNFWVGMLYMLWIIFIIILMGWGFETALMVASFLALILGLLLVYMDLVTFTYLITFPAVIILLFFYISFSSPKWKQ
jgi:hypothetical protein